VTTPPPTDAKVAFYAVLTHELSLGQHQIVEYDKVITNVGNAYDSRHGHFISPVKGVYLMSFTLMNKNGGAMDIEMVRNGVRVAHGYGGYNMGTQVVIKINKMYTNELDIIVYFINLKIIKVKQRYCK
jgi:hypothetical protein